MQKKANEVVELMCEYFKLKMADKTIREDRNAFLEHHHCTNKVNNQTCIDELRDGRRVTLCGTCTRRQEWYMMRQANGQRRSSIMRQVKRKVLVNNVKG